MKAPEHPTAPRRRAFVLAGVLVMLLLCSMVVMSLLFRMHAEEASASAAHTSEQGWLVCMSGVEEAMRVAMAAAPGSTDWRDNPKAFKDRFVYEDGAERWYFTIYAKADEDSLDPFRYGLVDEASKLNLNTAARESLAKLPGLEPELLDALEKKQTSGQEGEPDFFAPTDPNDPVDMPLPIDASAPADSSDPLAELFDDFSGGDLVSRGFRSFSQLLALKGFTANVVYGEDLNFNWRLDPNEDDGNERPPIDNSDGQLDLGLSQYLTLSSYDPNVDSKNVRRTDINDIDDPFPLVELPPALTNYITAIRTNHLRVEHAADLLEAKMKVKDEKGAETEIASGVDKTGLAQVLDLFSADPNPRKDGLVNINTASGKVLAALPGLNDTLAESILSGRKSLGPERRTSIAWLFEEGILTAEQFKKAAPFITARSFQYCFHVVAFSMPFGHYRALEAVVDTTGKGSVVSLRDLTRFGPPLPFVDPAAGEAGKTAAREALPNVRQVLEWGDEQSPLWISPKANLRRGQAKAVTPLRFVTRTPRRWRVAHGASRTSDFGFRISDFLS